MIAGTVTDLHAILPVTFRLPGRGDLALDFVIDTGFTGFLTLPEAAVVALGLPFLESIPANLANDTEVELPVYEAIILWNGQEVAVRILATGRRPLLGTALLSGQELVAQFTEGGLVTVDSL
jgi:clan AA aspartic protease